MKFCMLRFDIKLITYVKIFFYHLPSYSLATIRLLETHRQTNRRTTDRETTHRATDAYSIAVARQKFTFLRNRFQRSNAQNMAVTNVICNWTSKAKFLWVALWWDKSTKLTLVLLSVVELFVTFARQWSVSANTQDVEDKVPSPSNLKQYWL